MTPDAVLEALARRGDTFPRAAVAAAIAHGPALADDLLAALERAASTPEQIEPDEMLHVYALCLLAQLREPRAFEPTLALATLPGPTVDDLINVVVTEALGRILASVGHGRAEPLQDVIARDDVGEFVQVAMLTGLAAMVVAGDLSRAALVRCFDDLFQNGRLPRRSVPATSEMVLITGDLGLVELRAHVVQAFDSEGVDPIWAQREVTLRDLELSGGGMLRADRRRYSLITDALGELEWMLGSNGPVLASEARPKIGRNDPCPCGSGKKYKKCCLVPSQGR